MSAFSHLVAKRSRAPLARVLLRPDDFADTWDSKPGEDVLVGLRLIGESEWVSARAESVRKADRAVPGREPRSLWVEAYNQTMVHQAIAAACTHPDNIDEPYWDMAEDVVPLALSRGGAEHLYDEIEVLALAHSPLSQESGPDELRRLGEWLLAPNWSGLEPGDARAARRMANRLAEMVKVRG